MKKDKRSLLEWDSNYLGKKDLTFLLQNRSFLTGFGKTHWRGRQSGHSIFSAGEQPKVCAWVATGWGNLLMQIVSYKDYIILQNLIKLCKKIVGKDRHYYLHSSTVSLSQSTRTPNVKGLISNSSNIRIKSYSLFFQTEILYCFSLKCRFDFKKIGRKFKKIPEKLFLKNASPSHLQLFSC